MNTLSQARRDHITDMATWVALIKQPQVGAEFKLLLTGYSRGDLLLDLYGEYDSHLDSYEVMTATLTGTTVSLFDLIPQKLLDDMSAWCDLHLDGAAEREENRRTEAAAARMRLIGD